ncbi:hypothetical protein DAPPUDRAFT_317693 [Daphnia pulex]|uniref:Uncharacterized protein n=1 Tax=Daphnia pulex TaxID=6669 RepID=E9GGP9_DAPPU|nr:hypothetical protein DAPPUDRAFT_317693 [Daphnia pulex]|eukprot:EFX81449.1 hypothetical protein DAPPUDRAFT_317693 [Daphnia pulex]
MKVDAHFSQRLKVIFLNCLPSLCRQLSSKLGLPKSGPYWDSASEDESKKRLTLFPGNLNYATKNAIKKVFVPRGVYHEINHAEANRLLVFSASPEVRDALNRLHAGTSVPAETSVSSIDSQDVIGDKEDAIKDLPIDAEEEIGSNEFLRWKEGGLKGPFVAVNCRHCRLILKLADLETTLPTTSILMHNVLSGTFNKNMELHFSHLIQVLDPIVQNGRKPHLALL